MDAFQLLDHNCWRYVFRKLNAEDHLSCRLVCKPCRKLLDEREFQEKRKFRQILPLLFGYLAKWNLDHSSYWVELRKIRLVCQSWRESVDKYASEMYGSSFASHVMLKEFPLVTKLSSSEKIDEFHEKFGDYQANPFPSKAVLISNISSGIGLQTAYIPKVINFVERFGKNIFKLEMRFNLRRYHSYEEYVNLCELLRRISVHLPNLKSLCLFINYAGSDGYQPVHIGPEYLTNWIEQNPLPDLPKLQSLKIANADETFVNYLEEKYAQQLTQFERNYESYCIELHPIQFEAQLFGNLRKLTLEFLDQPDTLDALRLLQSPLQVLTVFLGSRRYASYHDRTTWNVDKALRNIKHLPLQELKIRAYPNVRVAEAGLELEEYINESIQTLSLHFKTTVLVVDLIDEPETDNREISFNFLQGLRKLEKLKLNTREGWLDHPEWLHEEVELNEHLEIEEMTPYESNVWEKVPSLKTLIVKRLRVPFWEDLREESIYTRGEYELVGNQE